MKLQLFQQIVELNQSFDRLITGLTKLESVPFFQRDLIEHARSDIEIAQVYANREFFDNFEKIVEDDAKWACRFQRAFNQKLKDRDDIYLEVRSSEERRKRKGLPPRAVILPGWDMSDEDRFDERRARQKRSLAPKRSRTTRRSSEESRIQAKVFPPLRMPKKEGGHS
jgi:hypothetical protein